MKRSIISCLPALVLSLWLPGFIAKGAATASRFVPVTSSTPRFQARDYGAACDGKTDDTAAIQKAIDAAEAAGSGVVEFPTGTCLLNSYHPSPHPWFFYNLVQHLRLAAAVRLFRAIESRAPGPTGFT